MNQQVESASNAPRTGRRPWWRFFVQFSLRTLLLLTTLAAVACWWWLQPATHREERGSQLKLQRQVRAEPTGAMVAATPQAPAHRDMRLISVGRWRLLDEHDELLAAGRYQEDRPHGWWTTYHANGRKAAQGQAAHGVRSGVWRVWDEQGRRVSEVTYRAMEQPGHLFPAVEAEPARSIVPGSVIPVVGMIGPLGQLGSFGGGLLGKPGSWWIAQRHGPAKAWHAAGPLAEEGRFEADRRQGPWKFYDEQGRLLERGEFVDDLREGLWTVAGLLTAFVGGRARAEHQRLLAQAEADLAAGPLDRQIVALDRLADLGRHGLPALLAALDDPKLQLLALRRCGRLTPAAEFAAARARIERLMDAPDKRVAAAAALLAYRAWPERRSEWTPRLLEIVQKPGDLGWRMAALNAVVEFNPQQRTQTVPELALLVEEWRRAGPDRYDTSTRLSLSSEWLTPEFPAALVAAMESPDPLVRCGVLNLIDILARKEPPQKTPLPGGGVQFRHAIPESFVALVQRAAADPDPAVQAAARDCGVVLTLPFDRRGGMYFTSPGLGGGMF